MAKAINFNPIKDKNGNPTVLERRYDGRLFKFPYGEKVEFPDDAKGDFLNTDSDSAGLGRFGLVELSYDETLEDEGPQVYLKKLEVKALETLLDFLESTQLEREEQFIREVKFKQIRDDKFTTSRKKEILDSVKVVKARLKRLKESK